MNIDKAKFEEFKSAVDAAKKAEADYAPHAGNWDSPIHLRDDLAGNCMRCESKVYSLALNLFD